MGGKPANSKREQSHAVGLQVVQCTGSNSKVAISWKQLKARSEGNPLKSQTTMKVKAGYLRVSSTGCLESKPLESQLG